MTNYATQSHPLDIFTHLISPSEREAVNELLSKPRESGTTKIDINISLSNNNIQQKTSVSFSKEQDVELEKVLKQLTEMYVTGVQEGFSKMSPGSTETKV